VRSPQTWRCLCPESISLHCCCDARSVQQVEVCQSAPLLMELPVWRPICAPLMLRKILCIVYCCRLYPVQKFLPGSCGGFHLHCQRCEHDWQWQTLGNDQREARAINNTVLGTVLYTGSQYSKVINNYREKWISNAVRLSQLHMKSNTCLFLAIWTL